MIGEGEVVVAELAVEGKNQMVHIDENDELNNWFSPVPHMPPKSSQ